MCMYDVFACVSLVLCVCVVRLCGVCGVRRGQGGG